MAVGLDVWLQVFGPAGVLLYMIYQSRRGRIKHIHDDVKEAKEMGKVQSLIIRALALGDEHVDQEAVDEQLAENGLTVEDFLSTRPDGGQRPDE